MGIHLIMFLVCIFVHVILSSISLSKVIEYDKNPQCENTKEIILSDTEMKTVNGLVISDLLILILIFILGASASPISEYSYFNRLLNNDIVFGGLFILLLAAAILNAISAKFLVNKVPKENCGKSNPKPYYIIQIVTTVISFLLLYFIPFAIINFTDRNQSYV
jgi:hypothetical protein